MYIRCTQLFIFLGTQLDYVAVKQVIAIIVFRSATRLCDVLASYEIQDNLLEQHGDS